MKLYAGGFAAVVAIFLVSAFFWDEAAKEQRLANEHLIEAVGKPYQADLQKIRELGVLRVLVVYSRTDFFLDGGLSRGIQNDYMMNFEKQLNAKVKRPENKVHVHFLPVTFDQLLPALEAGLGDVAAAFLTLTEERQQQVNFVVNERMRVDEIVVSHPKAGKITTLEDLSGKQVYVLRNSSYAEHLKKLNIDFTMRGLRSIEIVEADATLLAEDILELVNAGVVPITIVDNYLANLWVKMFPKLRLHEELKLSEGNQVGWAVRKNSPMLKAELERFMQATGKGTMIGNMLFKEYFANIGWIKDPKSNSDKLEKMMPLFRKYANKYDHDPLALAAQAFQESGLDQNAKSHAGAVGVMQLLPTTAADKNIGIHNIKTLENNIHAGAKYMAFLRDRYFSEPELTPKDRRAFTLAAYNIGPAKVRKIRELAEEMGLNPNVWSNNVEIVAAKKIGKEPVDYVSNIQKYQLAYELAENLKLQKAR